MVSIQENLKVFAKMWNGKAFSVLFFAILKISHLASMPVYIQERSSTVTDCIVKIIENLPGKVVKGSIITSGNDSEVLTDILSTVQVPVVIDTVETPTERGPDTQTYSNFVIAVGVTDVRTLLNVVLWNGRTRFLMLWNTYTDMECGFELFWKQKVIQVFALLEKPKGVFLYTFQPFLFGACEEVRVVLLDMWRNNTFPKVGFTIFREKIRVKNGNKCPLRISVVDVKPLIIFPKDCNCNASSEVYGTEAGYLENFAKKYNFTTSYSVPADGQSWGTVVPLRGAIGELYVGAADFGVGGFGSNFGLEDYLAQTRPFNPDECITFFVPRGAGKKSYTWLIMFVDEFPIVGWFFIVISLFAAAVVLYISIDITFPVALLTVYSSLITQSTRMRANAKYFMSFWVIISFVVALFYEASLGSQITVPLHKPEIKNFEELEVAGFRFMGHADMLDALISSFEPVLLRIANEIIITEFNIDIDESKGLNYENAVFVRLLASFKYTALINPEAVAHLRPMDKCVFTFPPVIAFPYNSPFQDSLDNVVVRLFESGISKYWRLQFLYDIPESPLTFTPLKLRRSLGIFAILLTGLLIASIIFAIETTFPLLKRTSGNKEKGFRKVNSFLNQLHEAVTYRSLSNFKKNPCDMHDKIR